MGWWRIDPKTGMPWPGAMSKLSPPGEVLLNAVPGVDDDADAFYLGDFPCDCAAYMGDEIGRFLDRHSLPCPSLAALLTLVLEGVVPPTLAPAGDQPLEELLASFARTWTVIDNVYEEEWGRPATAPERVATCRERLKYLIRDRR